MKVSLRAQFFSAIFGTAFTISAAGTVFFYSEAVQEIESQLGSRAQSIATTATSAVDGEAFKKLVADPATLFTLPEYGLIQSRLVELKIRNNLQADIYTMALSDQAKDSIFFVVSSDPRPFAFRGSKITPRISTALSGTAHHTGIVTTANGMWITGVSPIFDTEGQILGALEVALDVNGEVLEARTSFLKSLSILFLSSLAIAALVAFLFADFFSRRIRSLQSIFERLASGDRTARARVSGNDEISSLSHSFNLLADTLDASQEEIETKNKELEFALITSESANVAKSEFLANMSHEIRTPLNSVIGTASVMANTGLNPKQQAHVARIERAGESLLSIINDVLDFSKIEAKELTLSEETSDLIDICESVVELFIDNATAKPIELHCYIDAQMPKNFLGDSLRLRQILTNLVGNALKFTEEGSVTIKAHCYTEDGNTWAQFEVIDTGIGLSEKAKRRLFSPFVQADSSITKRYGGTGLGLSISKNLVELMDGRIDVRDNSPQGSVFWFTIPVREAQSDLEEYREQFHGLRALVVGCDDQSYLQSALESWGIEVICEPETSSFMQSDKTAADTDVLVLDQADLVAFDPDFVQLKGKLDSLPPTILVRPMGHEAISWPQDRGSADKISSIGRPLKISALKATLKGIVSGVHETPRKAPEAEVEQSTDFILVVEDNSANRDLMEAICLSQGIPCDFATDGKMGVEKMMAKDYRLVFMDWQMPVVDGITATEEIRKYKDEAELPIVAMTGNALIGDREKCLDAGMNDYLAKPVTIGDVQRMLDKWYFAPLAEGTPNSQGQLKAEREGDHTLPEEDEDSIAQEGEEEDSDAQREEEGEEDSDAQREEEEEEDSDAQREEEEEEDSDAQREEEEEKDSDAQEEEGDSVVHIDLKAIQMLKHLPANGEGTMLERMISDFLESAPGDISAIEHEIQANNVDGVRSAAHKFKSSCGIIGAVQLTALCTELEECKLEQCAEIFAQLVAEFERFTPILQQEAS